MFSLIPMLTLPACHPSRPAESAKALAPATQPAPEPPAPTTADELAQRPLYTFAESDFDRYLPQLRKREPDLPRRVIQLGRQNIGQPYQLYLLGEHPYETYDPDPLYCLSKSDCVTFAEHTYAAALARDWSSFFNILQRLRYKDGEIGMLTRNHYTIADWDRNNGFIFEDLTQKLGGGRVWSPLRETVKRARFFAKFGIGQDIPDEEVNDAYIPKERVPEILGELRSGDFVNIIRGDASSQWAGHVGLIALADDGVVDFLHSSDPAVREQPLMDYLNTNARCMGMKVLRLRENAQAIMDQEMTNPKFSRDATGSAMPEGGRKRGQEPSPAAVQRTTEPLPLTRSNDAIAKAPDPFLADSRFAGYQPAQRDRSRDLELPGTGAPSLPTSKPADTQPTSTAARVGEGTGGKPRMSDYRLEFDTPVDPSLQFALESIDRKLGDELAIPEADRACGVLDLTGVRLAMVRPDAMFYGASVPKIGILLAYFETHPETAVGVAPEIERELQLMIKRSDNDMAARYSQIVGLENIQRILQSDKYRLYDREHGGLWCGKHYGIDQPRMGDPVHDHSHAATVRQCLRYYLMLEQGRLVSPKASEKMKAIFAAPLLDFHNHHFVKGLNGRDVTLIRKSGEWEDWHLDTASLQHADRAYLLAAMAHHPNGREYLAALAAALDEALCGAQRPGAYVHQLVLHDTDKELKSGNFEDNFLLAKDAERINQNTFQVADSAAACKYESEVIQADHPFNQVLASWNIEAPTGPQFSIELRVGRRFDESWSPYLCVGTRGEDFLPYEPTLKSEQGIIDTDYFKSDERFDRVQYRVLSYRRIVERLGLGSPPVKVESKVAPARIALFALCLSDTTGIPLAVRPFKEAGAPIPPERWQRRLPVPHFSQATDRQEMKSQICSPASVAMVLAYRGVQATPEEVAERAFDPIHKIYGNWPYNVQAAYTYGVPGYITRFSDWHDVEQMIADDQPLVISIRYNEGELPSAPMKSTDGHLIVLCGFDHDGNVLVNDPATSDSQKGQYACRREDLEKAWMRIGGTAYVLLPKPK